MTEQNAGAGSPPEIPDNSTGVDRPDVEAIRARAAATTRGIWVMENDDKQRITPPSILNPEASAEQRWIADCCWMYPKKRTYANAEFIAHAHQDIPALLAEITRLEAEVQRMREAAPAPGHPGPVMSEKDRPYPRKYFPALYCTIYPMLCEIARQHGYALAIHGSLGRDMDLIAVPWTESAVDPLALIDALISKTHGLLQGVTETEKATPKPHGRVAYNIELSAGAYLDVSVMPKVQVQGGRAEG